MVDSASEEYRKYLDPKVLTKISGLELRARLIVDGFFTGMHRSPRRGISIEFADHRSYTQGDDIRHIDWKVYGRTDKYYIKEYEQETNLNLLIVVDSSESMNYRSENNTMTKYDYAASLAAAISYLSLQQHDSVGLALFDEKLKSYIRPSASGQQWRTIAHELAGGTGQAKTSMEQVLHELAERINDRTLIILISDLFDDVDGILRGFKHLCYRHHELVVWNLWDPAELSFPFRGPTMFEGLESSGRLLVDPRSLKNRYQEEVERFQLDLKSGCGLMQVDCSFFDTSMSLDVALSSYLATRSVRLRKRASRVSVKG